ncbi:hypothetical protein ACRYCC_04195 [Actinomadura scrupuli]|uniref:GHMP family kinase ATP-binding protein n=1 Tax=Actinomadura scrupuli TaxID=559629 RepID=UPI003D97ECE5
MNSLTYAHLVAPSGGPARPQGTGTAYGTCGELVQGVLDGRDFLITFPIDLRVRATASPSALQGVAVWPPHKVKARRAAERLLRRLRYPSRLGVRVDIASPLPEGKGMASSSADIVATCRALADLLGTGVSDTELGAIACAIEPSDAAMYERPVVFDFMTGDLLHDPGRRFPVLAVTVDAGGAVETTTFRRLPYTAGERRILRGAHDLAVQGLETGDLQAVGTAATASARVNQRRHAKPHLDELLDICADHGGSGVAVAHSGTLATMLFDDRLIDQARNAALDAAIRLPTATVAILNGL